MEDDRFKELEERLAQKEAELAELRDRLTLAAQKLRALLLQTAPDVPEELVAGETVEEVEKSFLSAQQVVEKVKKALEARFLKERVPAGAPPRSAQLSPLSPREKIAYGLGRRQA